MKRVLPLLAAALVLGIQASAATAANPPTVQVSISGTSGDNGWYRGNVIITWNINTDGAQVISQTGCQNTTLVNEGSNPAQMCAVTTTAGSTSTSTAEIRIDKTPPTIVPSGLTRSADSNGWYNHGISGNFGGTDGVSGLNGCSSATYTGPDGSGVNVSGTCRDNAGWQSTAPSPAFNYDDTPPTVTGGGPTRAPDANGWFNKAVVVNFTGTDATSGNVTCPAVTYSGPDGAGAAVPSSCRDAAGNVSTGSVGINYDASGPSVSGSPDRSPDANGWYSRPVGVNFSGSDNASGVAGCSATTYSGPDGMGSAGGSCSDNAGNSGSGSATIPYDSTAPEVTALVPARAADSNGWYNKPIALRFDGRDGGSGIATCTSLTYAGPDSGTATVSGSCSDKAGHTSAAKSFRIKYDATAPSLENVVVQTGNRFALLKWKKSNDVAQVRVARTPGREGEAQSVVYSGNADFYKDAGIDNGKKYDYLVTALDEAANSVEQKATAVPLPALYNPAAGARVRGKLVFEWLPVEGATYYNVQIWLGKRKVVSAWPRVTRLVVPQRGKLGGKRYTLVRGKTYRWYVWPGRGRKIDRRYGRLIGVSSFRYTR
jgi:hypothetical protein